MIVWAIWEDIEPLCLDTISQSGGENDTLNYSLRIKADEMYYTVLESLYMVGRVRGIGAQ